MSPVDSNGFRWIESNGFRWTLQDSCPVEILLDSAGLVQRKNMMEFRGLRPNIPDSARQKCQFGPCHTKKVRVTSPPDSTGFRRSPVGHMGQCTVLAIIMFSGSTTQKMCADKQLGQRISIEFWYIMIK